MTPKTAVILAVLAVVPFLAHGRVVRVHAPTDSPSPTHSISQSHTQTRSSTVSKTSTASKSFGWSPSAAARPIADTVPIVYQLLTEFGVGNCAVQVLLCMNKAHVGLLQAPATLPVAES